MNDQKSSGSHKKDSSSSVVHEFSYKQLEELFRGILDLKEYMP